MEKEFQAALRKKENIIQKQAEELSHSHSANITMRNQWFAVFEDMEKAHAREIKKLEYTEQNAAHLNQENYNP